MKKKTAWQQLSMSDRSKYLSLLQQGYTLDAIKDAYNFFAEGGHLFERGGYTVQAGDVLSKIAQKHGTTVEDIVALNKGLNPDKIAVGQVLKMPSAAAVMPTRQQIVQTAWQNENPNNKGLNANGTYSRYKDPNGKGWDVGPGLLINETISDKKTYTKQELDEAAYQFGKTGLQKIGEHYNQAYGTPEMPTPFDTVSVAPKLLMLDARYQNGSLPISGWPSLYKAVSEGNWGEALRQSRATFSDDKGKHYDNDRVRRRADSLFPGMFNVTFKSDSKELPTVTKKKADGGYIDNLVGKPFSHYPIPIVRY